MNRRIPFALNEYYHIYNRGVEKRNIFLEKTDWIRFQRAIFFLNSVKTVNLRSVRNVRFSDFDKEKELVAIGAYCLMPNHFHILVREVEEKGISRFVEKVSTSYAKYFNIKYERVGHLFQGKFKAEHVDRDEYLKYLFSYIHLNPIKIIEPGWREKGIQNMNNANGHLKRFQYSSYLDYCGGKREEELILNKKAFPQYFNSPHSFEKITNEWLVFDEAGNSRPE